MIRFMHLFNYASGVPLDDGETWYVTDHVPQVRKLPGVVRYRSWRQVDMELPYPGPGVPTPFDQFVRRSELCFGTLEEALKAVMGNPALWEPSQEGTPGFREFECMFLDEEPQYNLLRDAPPEHYKYMTLPLWWPRGRPQIDENEPIFIDSYCLLYRPDLTFAQGEDWYLGHHTREGKQLPGMKHYRTWKTIHVPEEPGLPVQPNRWARLTELGMSHGAFIATMVDRETRIRFTPSPLGNVVGGWLNISIKLEQVEDLLK